MSDSVQIEFSGKKWTITTKDLERLKGEIITLLEQRKSDELNKRLIEGLNKSAPMVFPDNTVHIGRWKLIVYEHVLVFECLAVLHENFRLYYRARLTITDEYWKVSHISSYMVKRLGL